MKTYKWRRWQLSVFDGWKAWCAYYVPRYGLEYRACRKWSMWSPQRIYRADAKPDKAGGYGRSYDVGLGFCYITLYVFSEEWRELQNERI